MNDKDKSENKNETDSPLEQEVDSPIEQEEEVIFPKKDQDKSAVLIKKFRIKFSPLKLLALVILVLSVYFAGFLTSPENFQGTVNQFKEWISASKEKKWQRKITGY